MKPTAAAVTGALASAFFAAPAAHATPPAEQHTPPQPFISIGQAAAIHAAPWQICASDVVAGIGGVITTNAPKTQLGDCKNNQSTILYPQPGVISILDGTSIDAAPWQFCASNAVGGVGGTIATSSPKLLDGDCHNSNTDIRPDGPHAPSLIAVLSGSAIKATAWQICGSTAVAGVGAVAAVNSPTLLTGDCTNAGIHVQPVNAAIPILAGVPLNMLPLQICQDAGLASIVGLAVPLNSPPGVLGRCYTPHGLPAPSAASKPA